MMNKKLEIFDSIKWCSLGKAAEIQGGIRNGRTK